jgi:hypothetical protein
MHVGAGFKPAPSAAKTRHAIPEIVRGFKTFSARRVNECADRRGALWQRSYYEHVIRNEEALNRIRNYIADNPARWAEDPARGVCRDRAGLKPAPTRLAICALQL